MQRLVILILLTAFIGANNIKIGKEEIAKWEIKTETPLSSNSIPLGDFVSEVTIPPQLLYSITLPFRAQILKVNISNYQKIKAGQLIAKATGQEWIEVQKRFIEESIELKHHKNIAKRKNNLCKEEIIPKKECHSADAEYKADRIKVEASKALLKSYGATPNMITQLFKKLKISHTIPIKSNISGVVIELNMRVGKSIEPSEPLLVLKRDGNLWLEAELPINKAKLLSDGEEVALKIKDIAFSSRVLQHSPIINNQNQTQKVKFLIPSNINLLAGIRDTLSIKVTHKSLKIKKKSLIYDGDNSIVFIRVKDGFKPIKVDIIAQDKKFYYIDSNNILNQPIAISGIAILKSLMEQDNE